MISGSRRDSVGGGSRRNFLGSPEAGAIQWGGVIAEIFSDLRKPSRFSGGGGSRRNFLGSPEPSRFSGGGGSSRIFQ